MNVFKKVVRWTPIVSMCMVFAMYLGMKGYGGNGFGYGNDSWVAGPWTTFGMNDFRSLIGHDGMAHWLNNAGTFICYFVAIELLLAKKWKAIIAVAFMMGFYLIVEEMSLQYHGVGASGWIMSIPGYLIAVAAYRANKLDEDATQKFACMFLPFIVFGLNMLMAWEDVKGLKNSTGRTAHDGHLLGAGIAIVMALIAVAVYLPRWTIQAFTEWKEDKAWKQRRAAMGY